MKKKVSLFLILFVFLFSCQTFAEQTANKWELLEEKPGFIVFLDNTSVYQHEDKSISFWLKYIPLGEEEVKLYHTALVNYAACNNIPADRVSDKIFCVYRVQVDFENMVYTLSTHYWYNVHDESFIASHTEEENWVPVEAGSDQEQNFLNIKGKISNI